MWLFVILVAVPIIEIALFLEIGALIGTWPTIGIIILTALIGSMLLRQQGLSVLRNAQQRLATEGDPGALLADGLMILIAGVLLLTPGFFTDTIGFALLVPAVRKLVWRAIRSRVRMHVHTGPIPPRPAEDVVDGEFVEIQPDEIPSDRR